MLGYFFGVKLARGPVAFCHFCHPTVTPPFINKKSSHRINEVYSALTHCKSHERCRKGHDRSVLSFAITTGGSSLLPGCRYSCFTLKKMLSYIQHAIYTTV